MAQAESSGELAHLVALAGAHERHSHAAVAGSPGSPDAVNVGVMVRGGVEVDHVRDAVDVDPTCGEVGRDERVHASGLKPRQGSVALALRLIAVDRVGPKPAGIEALDEAVGSSLGADEHDRPVAVGVQLLD
jgi:hypothetical protein